MEVEEILGVAEQDSQHEHSSKQEHKRETLKSVVFGGGKYIDKSLDRLCSMTDEEIDMEYEKYQRRIGAVMVKTLGKALLTLYSNVVGYFIDIDDKARLIQELNEDPFIDHAMNKSCCELYHKYGMYLAPLTTLVTTAKHCDFKGKKYNDSIITEDGPEREQSNLSGTGHS